MIEQRGRFEQEATERTELDSVLCFLGYLLLNLQTATFRADVDFFSCLSRGPRLHSRLRDMAGRGCVSAQSQGPEIMSDEPRTAVPL
jgi:hypothetical protein